MVTWSRRPCRPRRARADRSRHGRRARRARRGRRGRRARHGRRGRWPRGRERAGTGSCDFTYRRSAALGGAHGAPAEPRRHIWWIHGPHDSTWSRTDSPTMNSRFMQTVLTEDVCDTDTGLGEVLVVNCEYSGFSLRVGAYFFARGAGAYPFPYLVANSHVKRSRTMRADAPAHGRRRRCAQSSARTTHACREPLGARLGPPSRALGRRTDPSSRLS